MQAFDYALSINDSNLTNFAPSTITPITLNLAAGAKGSATLTVKALRGQGGGTDVTTVTASAPAHLNGSASATTKIQIGQTATVSELQTGTVTGKGGSASFSPATSFTVGSDVNIRSRVVLVGPTTTPVNNATVVLNTPIFVDSLTTGGDGGYSFSVNLQGLAGISGTVRVSSIEPDLHSPPACRQVPWLDTRHQ